MRGDHCTREQPSWQWPRCWRRAAPRPRRRPSAAEHQPLRRAGRHRHAERDRAARRADDGKLRAFGNTTRRNFSFQILPRVSGALRYSKINDWGSGDPRDLFDRSFDLQLQILNEQPGWQPSLTLGFRDILGTGVYSAEYLVASKTVWRDFTLTGGVGWGRLAGVKTVENPFCAVAEVCASATWIRRGRQARVGPLLPRRGHGLLRRRRVADADRQADAEGGDLVRRLHPRAADPAAGSIASRGSTSAPSTASPGRDARRLLHVRRHGRA